jgi:hypothetical protein
MKNMCKLSVREPEGKNNLGDLDVVGVIILNFILNNYGFETTDWSV